MLEIISPAGSAESVVAAVQNGADAVYLGFCGFNARQSAKNLTNEEIYKAAEYCRVRGVKTYITLNTLAADPELPDVAECAREAARCGAYAIIVEDLGVMRAVRQAAPDMPVFADARMGIHNLEGVKLAAAMGASRAILARELSLKEIAFICRCSPVDVCVNVQGELCMSYAGQCYMSALTEKKSDNRGMCAQPCRRRYDAGSHAVEYPLGLKDACLIKHLDELERAGVKSLIIEGRARRPEYSAIVTGIYSRAVKDGRRPSEEDIRAMSGAFARQGFTDGFLTDMKGPQMFGRREENDKDNQVIFATARRNYLNGELQRVPVKFFCSVKSGEAAKLAAMDDRGNKAAAEGLVPEQAFHRELTATGIQTQLHKTSGTPFVCTGVKSQVDSGLTLPAAAIGEMRREVLMNIMRQRKCYEPGREGEFFAGYRHLNREEPPEVTISITKAAQLSREILRLRPRVLYLPAEEIDSASGALRPFLASADTDVAVTLPRVIHDGERKRVENFLLRARALGIGQALVGNIGQIIMAKSLGFEVRGDFGLNVYNSQTLRVLKDLDLISATLPFEMRLDQISELSKPIDTELITYGRLPLMLTENCIVRSCMGVCACDNFSGLTDGSGANFPVVREFGCRNTVLHSKKLFMADKRSDTDTLGLWATRVVFTTENAQECASILAAYTGESDYRPAVYTRGLYYKGVE